MATLNGPRKSEDRLAEGIVRLKIRDKPVGVSGHTGRLTIATSVMMEGLLLQQYSLHLKGIEEHGNWQLGPGLSWCYHGWVATSAATQAASCSCC